MQNVPYTTEDCPVYEIEKCAIPEADPGLEKAGVEVCAVVKVEELHSKQDISPQHISDFMRQSGGTVIFWFKWQKELPPSTHNNALDLTNIVEAIGADKAPHLKAAILHSLPPPRIIQNRIIVRPAGCMVVASPIVTKERELITPVGDHAPEGVVECTHTAAYIGSLEGIANVPDEQLAMRVGTEAALPKEIRFDPKMHFGALWSYVDGLVKEGIANVFIGAAGPGEAPVGFNSEMQKQVYQAIAKVVPLWAQNNLLPAVLEAWLPYMTTHPHPEGIQDILEASFDMSRAAVENPAIADLIHQLFPKYVTPTIRKFHGKEYLVVEELARLPGTPEQQYNNWEALYIVRDMTTHDIMLAADYQDTDAVDSEIDLDMWLKHIQKQLGAVILDEVVHKLDRYEFQYTLPLPLISFAVFAENHLSNEATAAIQKNAPANTLERDYSVEKWEMISDKYSGGLTTFGG
jgi:hypothetical protein